MRLLTTTILLPLLYRTTTAISLPLSTETTYIIDASGARIPYVGINWPGAAETMLPEGLQYASISDIVDKIVETGFNAVRLTFAIQLVDEILDGVLVSDANGSGGNGTGPYVNGTGLYVNGTGGGRDVLIEDAFVRALGKENGTRVVEMVWEKNPALKGKGRLDAFDAIAKELASRNIYLHLDNHMSRAGWCCLPTDGNTWWGDTYFNATSWVRGLTYMAGHGKTTWPTFTSIGLRNELRPFLAHPTTPSTLEPESWPVWGTHMTAAAQSIHAANGDILIFFGGKLYEFDISAPTSGGEVATNWTWDIGTLGLGKKVVFEMHQYDQNLTKNGTGGCDSYFGFLDGLGADVVLAEANGTVPNVTAAPGLKENVAPLVMSEWGLAQADEARVFDDSFRTCLLQYLVQRKIGWMMWVLAGSHYIRQGTQDSDETYGLLDHDWSGYRGNNSLKLLKQNIADTYAAYNLSVPATNTTANSSATGTGTVANPTNSGAGNSSLAGTLSWTVLAVGCWFVVVVVVGFGI